MNSPSRFAIIWREEQSATMKDKSIYREFLVNLDKRNGKERDPSRKEDNSIRFNVVSRFFDSEVSKREEYWI
jgi:hypothetical protein